MTLNLLFQELRQRGISLTIEPGEQPYCTTLTAFHVDRRDFVKRIDVYEMDRACARNPEHLIEKYLQDVIVAVEEEINRHHREKQP